ncbi:MLP-like protein 43 [Cynara cardunculus var. scolymus]|uniref:Bet v I domain-containing protein n=1 Tax=Cynara cardunculus var. scolymus TaxID=59895 RepID=A0A103XS77_CYNCS|nr:MLP-like protein 43 [Cynara cardunculus var. scolymus]KVH95931.1 Bet v I domain-containing protein [Cynara cardunculus var. scolymus]
MGIKGKVVREVDIKCGGNFIHEFFTHKPHEMAVIAPDIIRSCNLVFGQWGASGSVVSWQFIHDGKVASTKEMIEVGDNKIVFKVIEGDALKAYNALSFSIHVKEIGGKQFGVWSVEFQKVNATIPDPTSYLDMLCGFTKDMNAYVLKQTTA